MDSLKREQKAVQLQKKKEEANKTEREKNREKIIEQMERVAEKRKTDVKFSRAIPDIFGNQGYPPIYEPSAEQQRDITLRAYRQQKEALLLQVFTFRYKIDERELRYEKNSAGTGIRIRQVERLGEQEHAG